MFCKVKCLGEVLSKVTAATNTGCLRETWQRYGTNLVTKRRCSFLSTQNNQSAYILSQGLPLSPLRCHQVAVPGFPVISSGKRYKNFEQSQLIKNIEFSPLQRALQSLLPVEYYKAPIFDPIAEKPLIGDEDVINTIGDESNNGSVIGDLIPKVIPMGKTDTGCRHTIQMSSLLKKRKSKMNKHKYKKRMKRDRYKRITLENLKAQKEKRKNKLEERLQKLEEKKQKQRDAALKTRSVA